MPRADDRARQTVASNDLGPWALLLLSPMVAFVPGLASHTGHSAIVLALIFTGLAGLQSLLLLSWRQAWRSAPTLEATIPFVTLFVLAVCIIGSRTRWPLLWIPTYLYTPVLAHLFHRTGLFVVGLFATGTLVALVELRLRISGTPEITLISNALLPPILYLILSAEPERERRAHAAIVAHAEKLERARAEERRLALARDVHDGIGAHLAAAAMQAEVAQDTVLDEPLRARAALGRLRLRLAQALEELTLLTTVRPVTTWRALGEELGQVAGEIAQPCELRQAVTLAEPDQLVDAAAGLVLRRAVQEGVTNAVRHGKARHIELELRVDSARAALSISDDGVGMAGSSEGFGRRGISARLAAVGGEARWEPRPGGGTTLRIVLPLRPAESDRVAA